MHRNIRQVFIGLCVVSAPLPAAQDVPGSPFAIKPFDAGPGDENQVVVAQNSALPGAHSVPVFRFTIESFVIEGDNPLSAEEGREVLAPFLGDHEGIAGLQAAAETLEFYLIENEFSFHRVILPPQTLTDGIVRLDVVAFKIGKIDIDGNEHFSDENILRSLPALEIGEAPKTNQIAQQRLHANDHPSKQIEVRFKESDVERSLDADITVRDSRPLNVFFTLNNTGTSETGRLRSTLGLQHSDLFGRDHIARFSYTTSPEDLRAVKQFGAFYSVPLYQLNSDVSAFYVNSNVDSGLVGGAFDVSGAGRFAGFTYNQRLSRHGSYRHSVGVSLEDKLFENDIIFQGIPIGTDVRSRPLQATYQGSHQSKGRNLNFYLSYAHNIPRGSNNDDLSYTLARFGADPNWGALRFGGSGDASLPANWLMSARVDGQYAGEPLIPGEQFGIGGLFSVRGYEEREAAGDSGVFASAEAWAPSLPLDVRLLGFMDYGYVNNDQPLPGERTSADLLSAGIGLRWAWRSNANLSVDVAHAFSSGILTEAGDNKIHFNLLLRY
jgi:hemolysin activation/secretion protein